MKFFFVLFLFSVVSSITNADTIKKSSLFSDCLQIADHPINKTGGPDWYLINVVKAFEICKLAYSKRPSSIEIIRSFIFNNLYDSELIKIPFIIGGIFFKYVNL